MANFIPTSACPDASSYWEWAEGRRRAMAYEEQRLECFATSLELGLELGLELEVVPLVATLRQPEVYGRSH